jgi:restriction endonuclease Mrr
MTEAPFENFLQPLLTLAGQAEKISSSTVKFPILKLMGLPVGFAEKRIPSGRVTTLYNRLSWSFLYLTRAGLLSRVSKGDYSITDEGRRLLATGIKRIDREVLKRYPEFRKFIAKRVGGGSGNGPTAAEAPAPEEQDEPARNIGSERGRRRLGSDDLSSAELLLPVLKAVEKHPGSSHDDLTVPALEFLAVRRKLDGDAPPDREHPDLGERIGTAIYYLRVAELLRSPSRGIPEITAEGRKLLAENLDRLTYNILNRYPAYRALRVLYAEGKKLEQAASEICQYAVSETADRIRMMRRERFRSLADEVTRAFSVSEESAGVCGTASFRTLTSGDGPDAVESLKAFAADRESREMDWILFICGTLPSESEEFVRCLPPRVTVKDEFGTAELMLRHRIGTSAHEILEIKEIDRDIFDILYA